MKKTLLKERFQQLAGLKPLYELDEAANTNLELKSVSKELYSRFKREGAEVRLSKGDGEHKAIGTKKDTGENINVSIYIGADSLEMTLMGDKAISFYERIEKEFGEDGKGFKFISRGENESWDGKKMKMFSLLPSDKEKYGFDRSKERKGDTRDNAPTKFPGKKNQTGRNAKRNDPKSKLAESVLKMTKILLSKRKAPLNEAIKLADIMDGEKFKSGVGLVSNVHYRDKSAIDDARMMPSSIKKEEGNRDQLVLVKRGKAFEYGINNGEVADLITYEEALAKL